jgi:hypothetical protein
MADRLLVMVDGGWFGDLKPITNRSFSYLEINKITLSKCHFGLSLIVIY